MDNELSTVEYASMLYDFYGSLLRDNQNEVMMLYHEDNLSLSEIATELGMTRQAVHYTLKRAEARLKEYEEKLGLIASYKRNSELASRARNILEGTDITAEDLSEIMTIIDTITE